MYICMVDNRSTFNNDELGSIPYVELGSQLHNNMPLGNHYYYVVDMWDL